MPWSHALTAAGLAAAALGLSAPQAAPAPDPPSARLLLSLHGGEDATGRLLGSAVLECDPDGGSHPHPAAACSALRTSGGDLAALRARQGAMCPMIYAPVTATATGVWGGRTVGFSRHYANRCTAAAQSGGVFDF